MIVLKCDWCGKEINLNEQYLRIKTTNHIYEGPMECMGIKGNVPSKQMLDAHTYEICPDCITKFKNLMEGI